MFCEAPFSVVKIAKPSTSPQSISKQHHFWDMNKASLFLFNHFMTPSLVLHDNFLCFVIIPHVFLVFPFALLFIFYVVGAEWMHTTCHCSYHKDPVQLHSSPLSSAKTGRYLLVTWRYLEIRWTWAFSHIGQNVSSIFLTVLLLHNLLHIVTS